MRLTVTTFLSLDGIYQGPGGPGEDDSGGFEHGGWLVPLVDEDFGTVMSDVFENADAFLLGRKTYDIFVNYWPHVTDEHDQVASKLNNLPKYVASRTMDTAEWRETTVLRDVASDVAKLKEQSGRELQVHGSGALVRSLIDLGLVDEIRLLVFPVVLGQGKRLFAEGITPTAMKLVGTKPTGAGVVVSTYQPTGKPKYGTIGQDV